jgi:hypothetical protein
MKLKEGKMDIKVLGKKATLNQVQWFICIFLATWKAAIRRIAV